jgi:hypothetical protein
MPVFTFPLFRLSLSVNSLLNGHIKTKALRVWELLPAKFKIDLDLALRIRTFIFCSKGSNMIKKVFGGYKVLSEKGKPLGGPYKTKEEAEKRLKQVEYFKHKK